jgi:CheY-like chemotaxis protein
MPGTIRDLDVLVVDDNKAARLMMREMLEAFGFSVETAVSGESALELLGGAETDFDLILMDWRMPGIDGVETIRTLREKEEHRAIPVILMTAFGSHEDMEAIDETLIDAFVLKPVKQSVLFDTIVQLFDEDAELVRASEDLGVLTRTKMYQERLRGAHVLLVEDNPVNQQVAAEILADASIRVEVASDGQEAVEKVRKGEYDGVLMDVQMPGMDGFEATRLIRYAGGFENLPIIAMTANAMKGDRERCLAAGMNDYIAKPIDVDQLFDTMRKWITPRPHDEPGGPGESGKSDLRPALVELPVVEGIDGGAALRRLGGRKELLLRLLRDFARTQGAAAAEIRDCLERGDLAAAERTAHTLKGLAGGIGAGGLARSAESLEASIRRGDTEAASRGAVQLEEDVRRIVEGIEEAVTPAEPAAAHGREKRELSSREKAEIAGLVKRLHRLLTENDIDAEEVFEELVGLVRGSRYARDLETLRGSIEAYDFAEARQALEGMDLNG